MLRSLQEVIAITACNGCGGCCNPVVLPYTQAEALGFKMDSQDRQWTLDDLTPMTKQEARERDPNLVRRWSRLLRRGTIPEEPHYFSCRHFDAELRTCTNYDQRPPSCRKYPWTTGRPLVGTPLPPACSFRVDIGETPDPLPNLSS